MTINARCRELIKIGDREFSKRGGLVSHWQEVAEHFHPSRADFTTGTAFGTDFAGHLMTGFPAMQARELSDQLATMLRPRQKLWARIVASEDKINDDPAAKKWLEWASERVRKAMYAKDSQFLRATKVGDKDFVVFGQCVIQLRLNGARDGLLYTARHLRDTCWCENAEEKIDSVHRCEKIPARTLIQKFPQTVSDNVRNIAKEDPYREIACRHIVITSDDYEIDGRKYNKDRFPFVSVYVDEEHDTILEEVEQTRLGYIIPRWDLGAIGQYSLSPATMLALPDARLAQQMTVSLLEASEKAVNPPLVATREVVRSDLQMYANGVTWIDKDYDERLGDALRPLSPDLAGFNHGLQMLVDVKEQIKHIFYLHKLKLPEMRDGMTAFEFSQRVSEYVRDALPLIEPTEIEYNGGLCDDTIQLMLENNGFGSVDQMPEILRNADIRFEFESPLQATADRAKVSAYQEMLGLLGPALQLDPGAGNVIDLRKALGDAIDGVGAPADWKSDPKEVEELDRKSAERMAMQNTMDQIGGGAAVAEQAGKAVKQFADAGVV